MKFVPAFVRKLGIIYRTGIFSESYDTVFKSSECWRKFNYEMGYVRSLREGASVDRQGNLIPWYTYPAIEFLSQLDFSNCSVFEYGAGASTNWWGKRAKSVLSVDDYQEWVERVNKTLLPNCKVFLETEREGYANSATTQGAFDVIVVDGRVVKGSIGRLDCTRAAIKALNPGGMVVLDNSDWLPASCEALRNAGLMQVDFSGFVPLNAEAARTSLFFSVPLKIPYLGGNPTWGGVIQSWGESPIRAGK